MAFHTLSGFAAKQPPTPRRVANSNPLCSGLQALFDVAAARELISGALATNITSLRAPTAAGQAADFSGTANQQYAHRAAYAITGPITIFVVMQVDALSNYGALIAKQNGTTSDGPYELRLGNADVDGNVLFLRSNTDYKAYCAASNIVSASASSTITIGVRSDAASIATTPIAFVNRTKSTLSTDAGGFGSGAPTDAGASVWIGRRFDGATQLDGRIFYIGLWSRALSDAELYSLAGNPWQLFEDPESAFWFTAAAGGDVSANLTGQAVTASAGTLKSAVDYALSGQAATSAAGTLVNAVSYPLSGQAATASAGTLVAAISQALSGQASTCSAGTFSAAVAYGLTGQALTSSAGTIVSAIAYDLSGQAATTAQGSFTANTGSDVSVNLTGQAVTASAGTLTASVAHAISGQAATAAAGTLVNAVAQPLSGQALTTAQGSFTAQVSGDVVVYLTGIQVGTAQGSFAATGGDVVSGGGTSKRKRRRYVLTIDGRRYLGTQEDFEALVAKTFDSTPEEELPQISVQIDAKPREKQQDNFAAMARELEAGLQKTLKEVHRRAYQQREDEEILEFL